MKTCRTTLLVAFLCVGAVPAPSRAQSWLNLEAARTPAAEWRGFRLGESTAWTGALYVSKHWAGHILTAGSSYRLSGDGGTTGGEYPATPATMTAWTEFAVGDPWASLALGAVHHRVRYGPEPPESPRFPAATSEIYLRLHAPFPLLTPASPFLFDASGYWDIDAIKGWYWEFAVEKPIPLWVGEKIPIGSIFVGTRAGIAFGQAAAGAERAAGTYRFADRGFTHWDSHIRLTLMPFDTGVGMDASFTLAQHWVHAQDAETETPGLYSPMEAKPNRFWFEIGLRLSLACDAATRLCPDL